MANRSNIFTPGLSWKVTTSTTTAATAVSADAGDVLCVFNAGTTEPVIIAWGGSTIQAVAPDGTPTANRHTVGPGSTQVFSIGNATHVAVKSETGTPAVYFSRGNGA